MVGTTSGSAEEVMAVAISWPAMNLLEVELVTAGRHLAAGHFSSAPSCPRTPSARS